MIWPWTRLKSFTMIIHRSLTTEPRGPVVCRQVHVIYTTTFVSFKRPRLYIVQLYQSYITLQIIFPWVYRGMWTALVAYRSVIERPPRSLESQVQIRVGPYQRLGSCYFLVWFSVLRGQSSLWVRRTKKRLIVGQLTWQLHIGRRDGHHNTHLDISLLSIIILPYLT